MMRCYDCDRTMATAYSVRRWVGRIAIDADVCPACYEKQKKAAAIPAPSKENPHPHIIVTGVKGAKQ